MNEPLLDMIEFRVSGELRHNLGHLLLMDTDGHDVEYDIACDELVSINPEGGEPLLDIVEQGAVLVVAPVASRPITPKAP